MQNRLYLIVENVEKMFFFHNSSCKIFTGERLKNNETSI
jgi:hypothetical protein